MSGKTEHRTAFGIIDAVTGAERARIEQRVTDPVSGRIDTLRRHVLVEPRTNYFVGRVQQDLLTNSSVGDQRGDRFACKLRWRPVSNVEIGVEPLLRYQTDTAQWVANVDSDGDAEEDRFLFGELDSRTLEENPDFSRRSLRSNLVLRWEYRPGSTLFVVWQQNHDVELEEPRDPAFEPLASLGRTFTDDGDNIFLIKVNRWIGL